MLTMSARLKVVAPKEVNAVRIIEFGIALWVIAFFTISIVVGPGKPMAVSFIGIWLGLWGRRYTKRRRTQLSRY